MENVPEKGEAPENIYEEVFGNSLIFLFTFSNLDWQRDQQGVECVGQKRRRSPFSFGESRRDDFERGVVVVARQFFGRNASVYAPKGAENSMLCGLVYREGL